MYYNDLPKPDNKKTINYYDAINQDIIQTIHNNFLAAKKQTQLFAQRFNTGNPTTTANKIWNFLKNKIKYTKDDNELQIIKMPNKFIFDKTGDCKSYSLFTAGILANLNFPIVQFRYTSYTNNNTPTHVYVVTADEQGKEIIIDGVYNTFNSQKAYKHKKDYTMQVATLSGIKVNPFTGDAIDGVVKKIALAPARGAYLGLVRLNFTGFATRIMKSEKEGHGKKLKKLWEKLGGKYEKLLSAAKKGAKKKRIFGITDTVDGIGLAPAAAAILIAATPIIIALAPLLKQIAPKAAADIDKVLTVAEAAAAAAGIEIPKLTKDTEITDKGAPDITHKDDTTAFKISPMLLIGGIAAIGTLLFLTKTKN